MKKIIISLIALLLLTVCMISCADKENKNGDENEISVENQVDTRIDNQLDNQVTTAETEAVADNEDVAATEEAVSDDDQVKTSSESTAETENSEKSDTENKQPEEKSEEKKEATAEATDNNSEAEKSEKATSQDVSCTAVWVSSEASLGGVKLNPETDGKMEMQLALFDDGEYIMAAYLDGEMLENYPQQDKYEFSGGTLKLASGWQGVITGEKMDLSYSDGTSEVAFHCILAASAE